MARPAKFTGDEILDAAARAVAARGSRASIADVGREAGAPTGSIYHRFGSRDDLLGRLWLRAIGRFHVGFLGALRLSDPEAAVVASARHVPAFCRDHRLDAQAMALFSQRSLAERVSVEMRPDVLAVNDELEIVTRELVGRLYGEITQQRLGLVIVATRLSPYGLVRNYLGKDVPLVIDDAAGASSLAIVGLGR